MNPNQQPADKLKLRAGEVHVIALQQLTGRPVKSNFGGGEQLMYSLTDGRKLFVDPYVQDRIRTLAIAPGEPFEIGMLESVVGNQRSVSVEVRRTNKTAGAPAQAAPTQQPMAVSQPHPTAPPPMYIPPTTYTPPVPPPPAPAPRPQPLVNGAGQTQADIMARCYCSAVDIAIATMACAEKKGLRLTVQFEDIRAMGTAMMIAETGRR